MENDWSYVYEIPILYNITLNASFGHITEDGKMIKMDKEVKLQSNLIIQKYKKSGNVHVFLSTVIGYITNPDKPIEGFSPWLWSGDRRNFTGYQLFTNTDGSFRYAFKYNYGKRIDVGLDIYNKGQEYIYPQDFFHIGFSNINTKGEGIYEPDMYCWNCDAPIASDDFFCQRCGYGAGDIEGAIIVDKPVYCDECGFLKGYCTCGIFEDNDDVCPYCRLPNCFGECRETGGGNGNGTSTGGGQGNPPEDNPIEIHSDSTIKYDDKSFTIIKPIIDSIKKECFSDEIFNSISISFENHPDYKGESGYSRGNKVIKWKTNSNALHGQIVHELFHAYAAQACGNKFKAYDVNNEIQARILQYAYCRMNSLKLQESNEFINKFIKYYKSQSSTDYDELVSMILESDSYKVMQKYNATYNNIEEVQLLLKKCEKYNSL